jgi:hypothetical protein
VCKHYANGTVRYGPLHQISLVGTVHEEVGGFFPDLLVRFEENPFLRMVRHLCVHFSFISAGTSQKQGRDNIKSLLLVYDQGVHKNAKNIDK